jgi:uncharacterized protein (DUF924 family)
MKFNEVYNFWFKELSTEQWYKKDLDLDKLIKKRFETALIQAINYELSSWRDDPQGSLSEVILLDQLSRNMYRDTAKAFAQDSMALKLSNRTIDSKQDLKLTTIERSFLYMPFMHSESLETHERAVELFSIEGLEGNLDFEMKHKAIIERFGRYPHRNETLGRESTSEEIEFLAGPGSSF